MNLFYRRPLALFCFLFAVASFGGCFLLAKEKLFAGIAFAVLFLVFAILAIFIKARRAKLLTLSLCLVFMALALLNPFARYDRKQELLSQALDTEHELELTVDSVFYANSVESAYGVSFLYEEARIEALLVCEYPTSFSPGDILLGTATPKRVEDIVVSSDYYKAKGLFFALISTEDTLTVIGQTTPTLRERFHQLNLYLQDTIFEVADEDTASMLSALLLGNRSILRDNVIRDFRRAGLSHLLAISGMHLSVLIGIMGIVLRILGMRKRTRCILLLLLALFYTALTGFSLSTVRAFIMIAFVYVAYLSGNQNDSVTALFFSLFLILMISPAAVYDIGLWMSFLAVLGILTSEYFTQKLSKWLHQSRLRPRAEKLLRAFLSAVIVSLFANVFVCLPMCLCFDELSLLSVPATLILSPFVTVLLIFAPLLLLSALVALLYPLSPVLANVCQLISTVMTRLISFITKLEGITVSLNYPFVNSIILPAAAILLLLLILPLRKKRWILLVPLTASVLFTASVLLYNHAHKETLTVDYLSYGESEMLVLTTPKDAIICDLSSGANQCTYDAIALTRMRYHTEVTGMLLTHYHTRHIVTFSRNADKYVIRTLYLPFPENSDEYYVMYSLIDAARKKNVDVVLFDRNQELPLADGISLMLTGPDYLKRSTHPTFALAVTAFDSTVTYVAESSHEADIIPSIESHLSASRYIILGTHGPKTKEALSDRLLFGAEYVFVYDENLLSHIDPDMFADTRAIFGSDHVTLQLQNKKQ